MTRLDSVYWIGGGSGAGKSTLARRLAERHRLILYSTDGAMADHVGRCDPERTPLLQAFLRMDRDRRWVERAPAEMLESFHWFAGEGFELILDDLRRLVGEGASVVVEGFRLLPRLVAPVLSDPTRAVWLVPTPSVRREAFERRGDTWSIAGRTSHPERARANLLERDRLFTDQMAVEAEGLGLTTMLITTLGGETDLADRVARQFGLEQRSADPQS